MSHHGREYERDDRCGALCAATAGKLSSAVALIRDIANGAGAGGPGALDLHACADRWLELNHFVCKATRQRARERRAIQLDAEIAKLRAEREAL